MTVSGYHWTLGILACVFWASFLSFIILIDPVDGGLVALIFFYSLLFLALSMTASLPVSVIRSAVHMRRGDGPHLVHLGMSVRQGVLISLLLVVLLLFQQVGVLVWWVGVLTIMGISLIELYFLMR